MSDDLHAYLDAIFNAPDGTTGWVIVAVGHGPHYDQNGKYTHSRWREHPFRWPSQAGEAIALIEREAPAADTFICPYLQKTRRRSKGNAAWRQLVHSDVDANLDLDVVRGLGGFVVESGSPGHGHAYIVLKHTVRLEQHEGLCRGLAALLGGDPAKISDNDVLRPPGSLNHKAASINGSPPDPVVLIGPQRRADGGIVQVDPIALAELLKVDISNINGSNSTDRGDSIKETTTDRGGSEPVDLDAFLMVKAALAEVSGDRSADTYRVIAVCIEAGLSLEQTRWVVDQRADLRERLAGRKDDDVVNNWDKIQDKRAKRVRELQQTAWLLEWPGATGQLGMAYRLRTMFPDRLLHVHGIGWMYWDDTRWVRDDIGKSSRAVYALFKAMWKQVAEQPGDDEGTLKLKAAVRADIMRCESSAFGVDGILKLAQRLPRIADVADGLDSNPYTLNTSDGIVDLRTGECTAHDPSARLTRLTGVGYDPSEDCPRWKLFLGTTFDDDQEIIDYVQRLFGYAAIGEVSRHILPFCHGAGDNGKTVLLEVAMGVLGSYAITAPANFLLAGRDKHETEIARLCGARLVVASEINQGTRFDEAKVKDLTGGGSLTGRFMRRDFFDFRPSHTLVLVGNDQPEVTAGGKSFWRRLRLIPFRHEVAKDLRNEHLARELIEEEGPAILAWIVAGAQAFIGKGLDDPPTVLTATKDYAESEDHVQQFVDECCTHVTDTHRVPYGKVYGRYAEWCKENGVTPKATQVFGRDLVSRGFRPGKSDGKRYVYGIMLATPSTTTGNQP